MPLDQATRDRVTAEARRRGVDPEKAIARAEELDASGDAPRETSGTGPKRPVADRLLVGFLPFVKVRELRALWLGLDDRIPDDEMTCGDYAAKHGGAAPAAAEPPA